MGGSIVPTFFGSKLLGVGSGYARGLEVSAQSFPGQKLSWEVNYSYAVVRFKALDGVLRPGDFDYGQIINLGASYSASPSWNVSLKWRYMGGTPYTPFDMQLSVQKDNSYFDLTRINTLRYPSYHRLDVRAEKRFSLRGWALSVYLEVQNLYNRKNVYYRFWEDGREQTVYFLPIVPLIALQAEF
jgi:outer membrane receptor protein involved in Fe transport